MSTSPNRASGAVGQNSDTVNAASDTIQKNLAAFLATPQRLMQINLEMANHTFSFMNRRMKAQAAFWTSIGQSGGNGGEAEVQRAFLETVTKDYAEEMMQLTDMALKNFASVTETVASAALPGAPGSRAS